MKKIFNLLSLTLLLLTQIISAQDVTISVQVLPPYSTYLPDYVNNPTRIFFTMIANEDVSVKLKATITGDNGISIETSPTATSQPIALLANQIRMFNGTDLKNYLNINNSIVTGINKNDLFNGSGIPEGTYTICIQALEYATGTPVSIPEPMGCSIPFTIFQVTPPELISPSCNEIVEGQMPQNLIFTWLPPPGVPRNTQYKLKIVELIPSTRNPNEAMNSATSPAFFETITNSMSFLYTPAQPALKNGNKYAWRVTASTSFGTSTDVKQSNFQNNGNSEVCSFEYKKTAVVSDVESIQSTIKLIYPIQKQKINNGIGFEFSWKASSDPKVKEYQVQMSDQVSDKEKIKNWNQVSDVLFQYQYSYGTLDAGLNLKAKLNAEYAASNSKNAWRVVGLDESKKVIDVSVIETYEIVDAPITDRIKLISPIQGKKIQDGYGLKFEWQSSKKQTVAEYQLQFTNMISQNEKITNWNNLSDDLFESKSAYYVKENTKDLYYNLSSQGTSSITKMAWRIVGLDANGFVVDKSNVETYEIIKDESEIGYLQSFKMAGYYIKINKILDKNPDKFSGTGSTQLWAGGPEVAFNFSNLKVKPYKYDAKWEGNMWMVIDGELNIKVGEILANESWFDLQTQADCDGTFKVKLNVLQLIAKVEGAMDSKNELFQISKDNSTSEAKVIGKWITNWYIPKTQELYEFVSNESTIQISFADKFDGAVMLTSNKSVLNMANGEIYTIFGSMDGNFQLKIKGSLAESLLSGMIYIPKSIPNGTNSEDFKLLTIKFKDKKNMNFQVTFDNPLQWKLNEDGSAKASISEAYVHLSDNGIIDEKFESYPNGLNFDKFKVEVIFPSKPGDMKINSTNLYISRICNKGFGFYSSGTGENEFDGEISISGYAAKMNESKFHLVNNKLTYLFLKGHLYVPFINDWAKTYINIDSKKLQSFDLNFDYTKKYYLSNSGKNPIYITLFSGRLENDYISISPSLHIKNSDHIGIETENFYMCDMQINPSGAVSFDTNFASNSESVCEGNMKWATYYRFDYGVDKIKLKQKAVKNDIEFLFSGDVILAQNIATTSKKEMGFVYHGKEAKPDYSTIPSQSNSNSIDAPNGAYQQPKLPKGGLSFTDESNDFFIPENTIEITDDKKEIQGGYEDGAQKFGGGFKLVTGDKIWGDYFELNGSYEAKQPNCKELKSKLILGKIKNNTENYSYWFFEFNQKGFVKVPIVPAVFEAYGFGGKAYYHMEVVYDNAGKIKDMNPNQSIGLGIASSADVQTAFDEGVLLHGKATIVTQFKGWSIDGIDYFITADAISQNNSSTGFVQARLYGKLNWIDKYLDGNGQIWGNVKDLVCIGEGQISQDNIKFYFGTDDFFINVGTPETPISAEVLCNGKLAMTVGTWLTFSKSSLGFGFSNGYDSGWKGLNLKIASAEGRLTTKLLAAVTVNYSPFKATGTASFSGTAEGKGCVGKWKLKKCIGGSCNALANVSVSMPNPVVFEGAVVCDVHKLIPNFTLHAKWSSTGGFSISL